MRALLISCLLMAAACAPQAPAGDAQVADAEAASDPNNCPAGATSTWEGFAIEAAASGTDCAQAQVVLTIRSAAGAIAYTETFNAAQNFTLNGAESPADMERKLNEWVSPPGAALNSTGDLPEWPAGAAHPGGEFPFYPEDGVDRASYEALRQGDAPMFCIVQGMESLACLLGENGAITKIGVQSFPG